MVDRQPSTINNSILRSNYTISMAKIFHPIALFFIICDNIIIFATAWVLVPTSFSHNRRRRSTGRSHHLDVSPSPSSLILHTIHHQSRSPSSSSRVLRWYHVHDNDSDTAKQSVDLSLVKKQRQNNNKQNIFLDDSINDGEEEKNKNEPQFYHNNDDDTTKLNLRILLIDNHDSYTYNLYQYISTMTIHPVHVIMNDAYSSYAEFIISLGDNIGSTSIPTSTNNNIINSTTIFNDATSDTSPTPSPLHLDQYFDCIILSPGPGQPSHPTDMGIVLETIRKNDKLPILGVCLGHQALGYVYGKEVKLSPCGPVHGLMSSVMFHDDSSSSSSSYDIEDENDKYWNGGTSRQDDIPTCQLFCGLPQGFNVVRYHSLVVDFATTTNHNDDAAADDDDDDDDDSSDIEPIAWCNGINESNPPGSSCTNNSKTICMALRHKRYPHYGVQFHPESIGTGIAGYTLLRNFCEFAHEWKSRRRSNEEVKTNHKVSQVGSLHAKGGKSVNEVQSSSNSVASSTAESKYRVFIHKVVPDATTTVSVPSPEQVFEELYSSRATSFWLDSSTSESHYDSNSNKNSNDDESEGCPIASNSRFSIMGSDDGPLSRTIHYFGREHAIQRRGLRIISAHGVKDDVTLNEDILSYLRRRLVEEREFVDRVDVVTFDGMQCEAGGLEYKLSPMDEFGDGPENQIPFDYRGGYVGYLGYEVRHDTQCWILEQEGAGCPVSGMDASSTVTANPNIPTASFLFAARSLLYDHQTRDWYIIGIAENDCKYDGTRADGLSTTSCDEGDVIQWIQDMKSKIKSIGASYGKKLSKPTSRFGLVKDVVFAPNRSKSQYISDIARSHEEIRNGESYELCLTNQLEAEIQLPKQPGKARHETPYRLYSLLRENNPAPFSAFMNFYKDDASANTAASLSICCSSPERFLSVRKAQQSSSSRPNNTPRHIPKKRLIVESKPIKGTAARYAGSGSEIESKEQVLQIDSELAAKLSNSVKDRAENLMIVDLLRNDLGRVCMVGSVHVPKLMHIESYATVHQMVSTVRGTLDGDTSNAIDVIEACFPGGSMTGAPKQRTMEILDEIEQGVNRGPYSGSLGYISLNGSMDMNIIIRTAVLTPGDNSIDEDMELWKASVGCGGAITALSDSDNEYNEMLLKSHVVRKSISEWAAIICSKTTQESI